jgi:hypothetical protein
MKDNNTMKEEEKVNETNEFKFGLYLNDYEMYERVFSADVYNQITRYSVNIKKDAKKYINMLQNVLSAKDSELDFNINGYNVMDYTTNLTYLLDSHNKDVEDASREESNDSLYKTTYVAPLKFNYVLYINNNIIIEREFYVRNLNLSAIKSVNLNETLDYIVSEIKSKIKEDDLTQMWEEFDIMKYYNMSVTKVRDLRYQERARLLDRIHN